MEHLLGCGAGPLSPRRARATSGQIALQASAYAGAFVFLPAHSQSIAICHGNHIAPRFTSYMRTSRMDTLGRVGLGPHSIPWVAVVSRAFAGSLW
jgi:hypothetical protein